MLEPSDAEQTAAPERFLHCDGWKLGCVLQHDPTRRLRASRIRLNMSQGLGSSRSFSAAMSAEGSGKLSQGRSLCRVRDQRLSHSSPSGPA